MWHGNDEAIYQDLISDHHGSLLQLKEVLQGMEYLENELHHIEKLSFSVSFFRLIVLNTE